jgi:polycystin 1L2
LEKSFAPNLRAQNWYNGDPPVYLSGFLKDKTHRLIGWPVMRQIRVRSDRCSNQRIEAMCEDDYHRSNEEDRAFLPSWNQTTTTKIFNSSIEQAFRYQSSDELDSYFCVADHSSYPGGGYVYSFRGRLVDLQTNLSELHRLQWIDSRTRAVIIQLNLYNPNVQLFTSIFIITEFISIGSLYPNIHIEPISFAGNVVVRG